MSKRAAAGLIAQKALDGGEITKTERGLLTPELLVLLAGAGRLTLTRLERDTISPLPLANLAGEGFVTLEPDEYMRFPISLRIFVQGLIASKTASLAYQGF
jgi:hypothetical protein